MAKPITYKEIKNNMESMSECKVITTEDEFYLLKEQSGKYASIVRLSLQCKCGEIFSVHWNKFLQGKRECNICVESKISRKTNFENIKKFVKENTDCKLLSDKNEYEGNMSKLRFTCACGEDFSVAWSYFKSDITKRRQCRKCGFKKISDSKFLKINDIKDFIKENSTCELVSKEYVDAHKLLIFKCGCGEEFETTWNDFRNSNKRQCNKCGGRIVWDITKIQKYIEKNSDCKLISKKYVYRETNKVKIECACGNEFESRWSVFLSGKHQCNECSIKEMIKKTTLSPSEYEEKVDRFTNGDFIVLGEYINCSTRVLIKHKKCGKTFYANPSKFPKSAFCPECHMSKGEMRTALYLDAFNITYEREYSYFDCMNKEKDTLLRFDFYLEDYNILIEYDGLAHFQPVDFAGKGKEWAEKRFKIQQTNDEIKNKYCIDNNIKLVRIKYFDFDNISNILDRELVKDEIESNNNNNISLERAGGIING